jgi:hypothetical protein
MSVRMQHNSNNGDIFFLTYTGSAGFYYAIGLTVYKMITSVKDIQEDSGRKESIICLFFFAR